MTLYLAKKCFLDRAPTFRIFDDDGSTIQSCDEFFAHLRVRDCSVYTLRAYAIGLAHFFTWLSKVGEMPQQVSRHVVGRYISEFSRGVREGALRSSSDKMREPRTINHRLSVLASYFDFHIRRDTEDGSGPWCGRVNPASGKLIDEELRHRMVGRDCPPRVKQRGSFRRRVPYEIPERLESADIQKLIDTAVSCRDKAILLLLSRTGQRIGDWSDIGNECWGSLLRATVECFPDGGDGYEWCRDTGRRRSDIQSGY